MLTVKKGQIYLAYLNGKGCEQRGKRPVLILQKADYRNTPIERRKHRTRRSG